MLGIHAIPQVLLFYNEPRGRRGSGYAHTRYTKYPILIHNTTSYTILYLWSTHISRTTPFHHHLSKVPERCGAVVNAANAASIVRDKIVHIN